jgi:MarR family transcriptional regulator, transcriptional regulator for hemolysin
MTTSRQEPIGLKAARTGRTLNRAFEDALAEAGGSLPTWLVLLSVFSGRSDTQRELAEAIGIRGPTLTHHLDRLVSEGLVTRTRDQDNRRIQRVELTEEGVAMFHRLRKVAQAFDARLRAGLSEQELAELHRLLERLESNVGEDQAQP